MRRKLIWRASGVFLILILFAGFAVWLRPIWFFWEAQALRLRLAGASSRSVILGGHTVHYYVRGPIDGPPIVLVHGLGGRAEDWINLAPYLERAGYLIYTPDLPGFGQSDAPPDSTYSIQEQAGVVLAFMDAMQLRQTDLAGWSMGGWIVQKVAAGHPERIRRLVLMDSAGLRLRPDWDTRLFTPTTPQKLDLLDRLLMPSPPSIPGFVARDILRESSSRRWVSQRAMAAMLTANDVMDERLPALKMPVLLLWGDLDQITPLSEGRAIHALIPQSRLEIAPGCGHLAPEQCSRSFGPEMIQFLTAPSPLSPAEETLRATQ